MLNKWYQTCKIIKLAFLPKKKKHLKTFNSGFVNQNSLSKYFLNKPFKKNVFKSIEGPYSKTLRTFEFIRNWNQAQVIWINRMTSLILPLNIKIISKILFIENFNNKISFVSNVNKSRTSYILPTSTIRIIVHSVYSLESTVTWQASKNLYKQLVLHLGWIFIIFYIWL